MTKPAFPDLIKIRKSQKDPITDLELIKFLRIMDLFRTLRGGALR